MVALYSWYLLSIFCLLSGVVLVNGHILSGPIQPQINQKGKPGLNKSILANGGGVVYYIESLTSK